MNIFKKAKTHLTMYNILAIGVVLSLLTILCMFIATFAPYKIVDQSPKPFHIIGSKVVKQGGVTSYEYDYCKYTDDVPVVTKRFIDGVIFQSSDGGTPMKKGCGHVHIQINVPETLPPGEYYLEITSEYHPNPFRTITTVSTTEKFKVIPSKNNDLD